MKSRHDFPNLNPRSLNGTKPSGRAYKVMVVDDKEFHRKQIVQILESEGYKILAVASNGKDALEKYKEHARDLDLITTDLDMPEIDGYALLFEITKMKRDVKIVFISDDTSKGVIQDLINMGATDFILKPIHRGRILARLRAVMKRDK